MPRASELSALQELGFAFINNRLCSLEDGALFKYDDTGDKELDNARYEKVAAAVMLEVYRQMEARGLQPLYCESISIPNSVNVCDRKQQCFLYASKDAFSARKLLILIHGGGAVRAGIWSRRVIINDGLNEGSQLPYIERARQAGYGVLVLNGNLNSADVLVNKEQKSRKRLAGGKTTTYQHVTFRNSETPERHANYVWRTFVSGAKAQRIAIVAHSYGGHVTLQLAARFAADFERRVVAICFTDSVHMVSDFASLPVGVRSHVKRVACNWAASSGRLDTPIKCLASAEDINRVSAGESRHEWTSHAAIDSIFQLIDLRMSAEVEPVKRRFLVAVRSGAARKKAAEKPTENGHA